MLAYNSAFVFAALGLFELYLVVVSPPPKSTFEGTYSSGGYFVQDDPDLGYSIKPERRVWTSILKARDGSTIYDVKYSINQYGFRQGSPPLKPISQYDDKAVFFFGDSFTFGEGVNDEDTLPQQFSVASGIRVINFGVQGYGPHQMLRMLEINRPRIVESNDPLAIVYTILPSEHMVRAAGRRFWDERGPHYEVIDGALKYLGSFGGFPLLVRILRQSYIYSALLDEKIRYIITDNDRQRLLAILLRARDLSRSRYHAPFFVVLWGAYGDNPGDDTNENWVAQRLEENEVPTLQLTLSVPALNSDGFRFPIDGHPTANAYTLVANALKAFLDADRLASGGVALHH
jgi:hypothetical protein